MGNGDFGGMRCEGDARVAEVFVIKESRCYLIGRDNGGEKLRFGEIWVYAVGGKVEGGSWDGVCGMGYACGECGMWM